MTPSAFGAAESWHGDVALPEAPAPLRDDDASAQEFDLLAQEDPARGESWQVDDLAPDEWGPPLDESSQWAPYDEAPPPAWQRVSAFETAGGLSGRGIIVLGAMAAALCAGLDLVLTHGRITFFFDLCFVVICLVTTMAVRRSDLFTAGVLPPLLFAAVIAALSVAAPHAFESAPGVNKVFLTGLANHAVGLVSGYAVALAAIGARMAASRPRP